ncbi:hypothetical protein [Egicoccus sp. AB-alg2]|uniref:AMIN-like domain-containing (lipo)protein n=1 Tax=Egicoccus sp. AB-alg2 TaxID=3242693 RepID=UPI00359E68BC
MVRSAARWRVLLSLLLLVGVLVPAAEAAAQPAIAELTNVRTGGHPGFDRIVFDYRGRVPRARVQRVDQVVEDGSGRPIRLRGRAFLQVTMQPANAHDEDGRPTYRGPRTLTPELPVLRQAKFAGDFEAVVSWGLGLRANAGFRVLRLSNPSRVVVDVAHPARPTSRVTVLSPVTPRTYRVVNVRAGSSLNVRSQPGVGNTIVARLPSDATGIRSTGNRARVGDVVWRQIWLSGRTGWVSSRFLQRTD